MTGGLAQGWPRCSFVADAAGDAMPGSAPPAEQWLLLEHPGPWGRHPPAGSGLPDSLVGALTGWAARRRGRVLLIRRPWAGRPPAAPGLARSAAEPADEPVDRSRRWFRVDSRPGRESVRAGRFDSPAEALQAIESDGETWPEPLALVCAHGRHDPCCAVRGRPIAAALAATGAGQVWESSHLGGCRFAPTMVLLPHGIVLGRMAADRVPGLLDGYRAGLLPPPDLVRGRSAFPPAVQAAQHHARAVTGVTSVDALRPVAAEPVVAEPVVAEPVSVEPVSAEPVVARTIWRVRLAAPDVLVELAEHRTPAGRPLTCAATTPGLLRRFELLTVDPGTPGPSAAGLPT